MSVFWRTQGRRRSCRFTIAKQPPTLKRTAVGLHCGLSATRPHLMRCANRVARGTPSADFCRLAPKPLSFILRHPQGSRQDGGGSAHQHWRLWRPTFDESCRASRSDFGHHLKLRKRFEIQQKLIWIRWNYTFKGLCRGLLLCDHQSLTCTEVRLLSPGATAMGRSMNLKPRIQIQLRNANSQIEHWTMPA